MSKEEKKRLIEAAKTLTYRFSGYYKYTFNYVADFENGQFSVVIGGDSGDIYRFDADPEMTFEKLDDQELDLNYWVGDEMTVLLEGREW